MPRYLMFVSQIYAYAILRPIAAAIAQRGGEAAWFFEHERDARYLRAGERRLHTVADVQDFAPRAVFVPGNWVPHFFPGLKVEVFHGFSVGKRSEARGHFRIRGSFDLYCTHGPDTTAPFTALARRHGYFRVVETGWPKLDPLFAPATPRAAHRGRSSCSHRPSPNDHRGARCADDHAFRRGRRMGLAADAAPENGADIVGIPRDRGSARAVRRDRRHPHALFTGGRAAVRHPPSCPSSSCS